MLGVVLDASCRELLLKCFDKNAPERTPRREISHAKEQTIVSCVPQDRIILSVITGVKLYFYVLFSGWYLDHRGEQSLPASRTTVGRTVIRVLMKSFVR